MKTCPTCGREFPDNVKFCPNDGQTLKAKGPTADLVGQVVADRYHIIKKLGEGGMGAVYLGEHVKMGRKSAIKVMAPSMAQDPDAIGRFNREAANASRISHPNVCQIYDFGETPDGIIYLAMEFIEGQSLTGLIEKEGALPAPRAASILRQAADALQAAHDLGIVHRDIKPDNIMVVQGRDGSDVVKVVDFGIARAVGGDEAGQKVTKTGLVVGTPEYMSPEQLSGDKLDGRSDIYSLGLVLYRMLTGVLPFQADSAQETMIKRLTDDPMPLVEARPDIVFPDAMQPVLDKALARMRDDRYQNAGQLGKDTEKTVAGMAAPGTRADAARLSTASTQLMDEQQVKSLATKAQAATKRPGATREPPPPPPKKKLPVAMYAVLGVVVVGGLFGVAALTMGDRNGGGTPPDSQVAIGPGPDTAKGTGRQPPDGQKQQNGGRPGPGPGTQTRESTTTRDPTTTTTPINWVAIIEDSANAAVRADQAGRSSEARRLARWVYYRTEATNQQKADMAMMVATTLAETDTAGLVEWSRNGLRYASGQLRQNFVMLLQSVGAQP